MGEQTRPPVLILASASPRRREILTALGVEFAVVVPDVDELTEGAPNEVVIENARRKALAGRELAGATRGRLVLGADTEVVLDGRLLGKAETEAEARARLEALAGRTHEVLGGLVLLNADGEERRGVARSLVTFRDLDEAALELYLGSGEWRDRAGAYAIQGFGSILLERLEGDLSNVIGLPIPLFLQLAPELFRNPKPKVYP